MGWRLKVGRAAGIDVFLHWTFFIVPLFVLMQSRGQGWVVTGLWFALVFCLFACVLLHEYGHALAARLFGVPTRDIILTPIGGLARLERMPRKPMQELIITLAGPAVNLVIAIGLFIYLLASGGPVFATDGALGLSEFPRILLLINSMLFLFNLIPAFPMDGGRILRSFLAFFVDFHTATRIAGTLGQVVAVLFVVYGITSGTFTMTLIGLFVFFAAGAEIGMSRRMQAAAAQQPVIRTIDISFPGSGMPPSLRGAPPESNRR